MNLENLTFELKGDAIGLLTVNRPKALNALNSSVLQELASCLEQLHHDSRIRALVLTGAGEKAFIAGADIAEMAAMSRPKALEFAKLGQRVSVLLESFPCPVIAAVNGYALGGGCEMAMACDFILASPKSVFGQPEVALGLITGFGGAVRLAEFVGWPMARELIYTGRRINAEEAYRIGLVNKVVAAESLMDEAFEIAREIGKQSPLAVRSVKRAMLSIRSTPDLAERLAIEARAFSNMFESFDQREGTQAFIEKRKPEFKGE